ncbi:hypothetical protein LTR65_000456 [Meristemomyces frigidus]
MAPYSPLLGLPRELRDIIHQFVILAEQPVWPRKAGSRRSLRRLTSRAAFITTSKQLHDEYFEMLERMLTTGAPGMRIQAFVSGYDFQELQDRMHIDRCVSWQTYCQDNHLDTAYNVKPEGTAHECINCRVMFSDIGRCLRTHMLRWGPLPPGPEMRKIYSSLEVWAHQSVHARGAERRQSQGVIGSLYLRATPRGENGTVEVSSAKCDRLKLAAGQALPRKMMYSPGTHLCERKF